MDRHTTAPARRRSRHRLVAALVVAVLVAAGASTAIGAPAPAARTETPAASAPAARTPAPANPLAGHRLGVYQGPAEQSWQPYVEATGARKQLLAKIALRPKAKWFGDWIPTADIAAKVREYIDNAQQGDADVVVPMTIFRMVPWEHEACTRLPTDAERAAYRQWIDGFATGVGASRTAIILQPDGPFALCAPQGSTVPSRLIGYAAQRLSALAHTSVYIDAGAADWPKGDPAAAARILLPAGIEHARGFALNSTHYVSVGSDIAFGTQVLAELADHGVRGKHFVINTAQNGRPFLFGQAKGANPDNAKTCETRQETRCVTLGIPPTTAVASSRWPLSPVSRRRAAAHVDAYLWFGRPWLRNQANPFVLSRALAIARTTPY